MPSTYTINNKLTKQGTGDNNTTWGDVANTVFDLVDASLDGITSISIAGSSPTQTLTMSDGSASDARSRVLVFTGARTANMTITIAPNTVKKVYWIRNNTTGGFNIVIAQGGGSGSTVTIPAGNWAIVFCDGTGTNANVTTLTSMTFSGTLTASAFSGSGAALTSIPATGIATLSHVRATTATPQSIPAVTPTLVAYGTEVYDTLGEFNPSTSRFTATAEGKYLVSAAIELAAGQYTGGGFVVIDVYIDGVVAASNLWSAETTASGARPFVAISTTVHLAAGDYVEIFARLSDGTGKALSGSALRNYLTIDRLI